jgi:hypothetical protein
VITNVLVEHPWLSPLALALAVLLGPLLGARLASRPRAAGWLAAVSLLPVAVLTLVPVDRQLYARCTAEWVLPTPGRVELAANVVLFVAPALLAAVATRRPLLVLGAASVLSAAVEALQAAVPALGRSCDTSDWLSNTIGAALGVALAVVALRLADGRRRPAAGGTTGHR